MGKQSASNLGIEIERKFLVKGEFKRFAKHIISIKQGYLSSHAERTIRIRIADEKGFLTIKGKSGESGMSRLEWEKEIPLNEAESLFALCEPGAIVKSRFIVEHLGDVYEVDEFYGDNNGLVVAEIELKDEKVDVVLPNWIGEEVTNQKQYYNSSLIKKPFIQW